MVLQLGEELRVCELAEDGDEDVPGAGFGGSFHVGDGEVEAGGGVEDGGFHFGCLFCSA